MSNQHFRISNLFSIIIFFLILILSLSLGCSRATSDDDQAVAVVNEDPITLKNFQKEIALRSKQNPAYEITPTAIEGQLDTIIDRRLMIQEAMKMGLAGNEDFVRTIQAFWKQTLIRELIENKNREWEERLFVTEREIRDYYRKAQQIVTFKVIRTDDEKKAEEILKRIKKEKDSLDWEIVGPIAYFDVDHPVLKEAFHMSEGQIKMLKDGEEFLVIAIEKKETIALSPLEEVQGQIKKEVLESKKTEALEEWLAEVRGKADIEISANFFDMYIENNGQAENVGGSNGR